MKQYIDGFILPLPAKHLKTYQEIAQQVGEIWKEYGAISYQEFVNDDALEGTVSFPQVVAAKEGEVVIFGWVVFPSKEVRDDANAKVPQDKRMENLVAPLVDESDLIFDASRMVYGGFNPLVQA